VDWFLHFPWIGTVELMSTILESTVELIRAGQGGAERPGPACSTGLSDGLGERLLFATEPGTALELLRVNPELGEAPGFEDAVRGSAEALGRLAPSLATVQAVERSEELGGLVLVSSHPSGRRLSELIGRTGDVALAIDLVTEIGPTLALLHEIGHAHGALTPDRIVVSGEGRLIVLEHVLGAGLGVLALPAERLRQVAGIAAPDRPGPVIVEPRIDVIQLGFIALALVTGQRLTPSDYPRHIGVLLDHFSRNSPEAAAGFRPWLEQALQVADRGFANASEALASAWELPQNLSTAPDEVHTGRQPSPTDDEDPTPEQQPAVTPEYEVAIESDPAPWPVVMDDEPPATEGLLARLARSGVLSSQTPRGRTTLATLGALVALPLVVMGYMALRGGSTEVGASRPAVSPPPVARAGGDATVPDEASTTAAPSLQRFAPRTAQAERQTEVSVPVPADPAPPATTAAPPPERPETLAAAVSEPPSSADGATADQPAPTILPAPSVAPSPPPEPGRLDVRSPIELQVFDGPTLLGSASSPISMPAGEYTLDLVNAQLGFRDRQTVSVVAGEAVSITAAIPKGRVDINAVPWADVWIDGAAAGQTPLANLSLPIGLHEVVFRHPELGERRETVVVRVDGIARASVIFQR